MALQIVSSHSSGTPYVANTLTDLYTCPAGSLSTMSLSISVYNPETTDVAIEIWRTNAAGTAMQQCIANILIAPKANLDNNTKYGIKPGEKIRFKSASINVMFSATLYDGLA